MDEQLPLFGEIGTGRNGGSGDKAARALERQATCRRLAARAATPAPGQRRVILGETSFAADEDLANKIAAVCQRLNFPCEIE